MRKSYATALVLAATLVCAVPAAAQQQAYAGQQESGERAGWTAGDEDRSTVLRFLERAEVGSAAADMGVDVQTVGRAVLDLSDADAARLAGDVRNTEQALAADVISFTTTTLIIILLVVILLVLVVD